MSVVDVACSCDAQGRYAAHSAAMLHSLLANRGGADVRVHYLVGDGFPADTAAAIGELVERHGGSIAFVSVSDEPLSGLRMYEHAAVPSSWYRVLLPDLLPEIERVLYLDLDLIVLDTVAPLWEIDLGDNYLAAVTNVFMDLHAGREAWLGMDPGVAYFNNGVMLMNLEQWRAEGCSRAVMDYAREHPEKLGWPDQDAINIVLGGRRVALHPRWNCMNSVLEFSAAVDVFGAGAVEEARRNPAIRHFEGPSINKPWHYMCDRGMRDLYFRHRRETPWPDVQLEGRTPRNVARRALRGLRLTS